MRATPIGRGRFGVDTKPALRSDQIATATIATPKIKTRYWAPWGVFERCRPTTSPTPKKKTRSASREAFGEADAAPLTGVPVVEVETSGDERREHPRRHHQVPRSRWRTSTSPTGQTKRP